MVTSFSCSTTNTPLDVNDQNLTEQVTASTTDVIDKVMGWLDTAITMLPNFAVAVLVVLLFVGLAKLAKRVIGKILTRFADNPQIVNLITSVVYIAVTVIGVFIALGVLNLDKTVTSLLAGVGIVGLALGFAFQDIAANFVSGVFLAIRNPISKGDIVETDGVQGVVQDVNLRTTVVRTFDGAMVLVPNREVFNSAITNYSTLGERRVDIPVGVGYDDDLELAERVAQETLDALPMRKEEKPAEVFFTEFGDSSINMTLRFWIDFPGRQVDYLKARSVAIMRIKAAFDEADLNIPFPIRTLDMGPLAPTLKQAFHTMEPSGDGYSQPADMKR